MRFYSELLEELIVSSENSFSFEENYDHVRFGEVDKKPDTFNARVRKKLEKVFEERGYKIVQDSKLNRRDLSDKIKKLDPYLDDLENLYDLLSDDNSKRLMLQVLAFRILGSSKVKLPLSTPEYWKGIKEIEELSVGKEFIRTKFMNWRLPLINLSKKGIPLQLFFLPIGIYSDFVVKQYEFSNGLKQIKANLGDYVIDAGGCWGDTALYFANEVGENGRVFTYEFIPSNLEILNKNLVLNPAIRNRISIIEKPVWEISETSMFYIDNGPGSQVFMDGNRSHDGQVSSLSIDDLVAFNSIAKVDFIKMDIEGAEPFALKGATETIKKFRPKLAIAIYHSLSDFVNIPRFINDLALGYEFHFAHCSIHEEESILFAEIPKK